MHKDVTPGNAKQACRSAKTSAQPDLTPLACPTMPMAFNENCLLKLVSATVAKRHTHGLEGASRASHLRAESAAEPTSRLRIQHSALGSKSSARCLRSHFWSTGILQEQARSPPGGCGVFQGPVQLEPGRFSHRTRRLGGQLETSQAGT